MDVFLDFDDLLIFCGHRQSLVKVSISFFTL